MSQDALPGVTSKNTKIAVEVKCDQNLTAPRGHHYMYS